MAPCPAENSAARRHIAVAAKAADEQRARLEKLRRNGLRTAGRRDWQEVHDTENGALRERARYRLRLHKTSRSASYRRSGTGPAMRVTATRSAL